MSNINIRYADVADAAIIAALSRQTFTETFAEMNSKENMDMFLEKQFTTDMLMQEVQMPDNIFLLAYDADKPVGYAAMRDGNILPELKEKAAIEIARIYATQQSIGKGVGKALMQKCIDIAVEKKKEIVWLGVWEKNERAIKFYHKWGFEKFSTHVFQLGTDPQTDWLMMKKLF